MRMLFQTKIPKDVFLDELTDAPYHGGGKRLIRNVRGSAFTLSPAEAESRFAISECQGEVYDAEEGTFVHASASGSFPVLGAQVAACVLAILFLSAGAFLFAYTPSGSHVPMTEVPADDARIPQAGAGDLFHTNLPAEGGVSIPTNTTLTGMTLPVEPPSNGITNMGALSYKELPFEPPTPFVHEVKTLWGMPLPVTSDTSVRRMRKRWFAVAFFLCTLILVVFVTMLALRIHRECVAMRAFLFAWKVYEGEEKKPLSPSEDVRGRE